MLELLKDMKKIKEDAKSVTFSHPKGHSMTVMFKGLPLIQREAIKRLPLYEGGEAKLKGKEKEEKRKNFDEGGAAQNSSSDSQTSDNSKSPVTVNVNTPQQAQPAVSAPAPAQPVQPPQQAAPALQTTNPHSLPAAYGQVAQQLNAVQQSNANARSMIDNAYAGWQKYNANPASNINENQYVQNMSLPKKISTAIGLFLGNFSVPFGGKDFTGNYLNQQIQNNIQAQRDNYGHQQNVWGAAKDLFQDDNVANNFAHIVALDQVNNLVKQAAVGSGDPVKVARGQNLINNNNAKQEQLKQQSAQILSNKQMSQNAPEEGIVSKFLNGRLGTPGISGPSQANIPNQPNQDQESVKPILYPVLSSDAQRKLQTVQYGPDEYKQDYPEVQRQYTAAQQLGKVLNGPKGDGVNGIHDIFNKLYQSSGAGGPSGLGGALQRMAHIAIPGTGQTIKVPAVTESQKYYELQQNRLKTDLASALHGIVSVNDIDDMVSKFSPGFGDTPELVKEKETDFVNSIKNALQSSQLGRYQMLAK